MTGFPLTTASAAEWSRELKNMGLSIFDVSYLWYMYFQILETPLKIKVRKFQKKKIITSIMGLGVSQILSSSG